MPVTIPSGVDVTINGREVTVTGPKGKLSLEVAEPIQVSQSDGVITVTRPNDEGNVRALHGLSRSLVANMVTGVTEGYRKTLEIVGVGYRVQARGPNLEFSLGFSHPVLVEPPAGITFQVAATNQDGSPNSPSNCASRGTTVTLYGTGQGFLPNAPANGDVAPAGVTTGSGFRVVINPASGFVPDANMVYSGLTPGSVGVWQIDVTIPSNVPPGNNEIFVLDPNGTSSIDSAKLITTLCVKQ